MPTCSARRHATPSSTSTSTSISSSFAGRHPHIDFDAWLEPRYYSHYREYTRPEYGMLLERAGLRVEWNVASLGPWPARARNRYYRRRRSILSPVTWAIYAATAVELLVPPVRHSVYCLATRN